MKKFDVITLEKTETGYDYSFKSSIICQEENYSGTLIMNGNVVTADKMEMHTKGIPC